MAKHELDLRKYSVNPLTLYYSQFGFSIPEDRGAHRKPVTLEELKERLWQYIIKSPGYSGRVAWAASIFKLSDTIFNDAEWVEANSDILEQYEAVLEITNDSI